MSPQHASTSVSRSRRQFLKASALAATAAAVPLVNVRAAEPKRTIRVALIGCGGRGTGALEQHITAAKVLKEKLGLEINIQVVAIADWFKQRAVQTGKPHGVPENRCYGGATAYRGAIEAGPDVVLIATHPVFRPLHLETAVRAGKHVFFEKPVAVDPPGVRRVIAAGEEAKKQNLVLVAGTQRRHMQSYNQQAREIQQGAYGRILGGRVAWNQGAIFTNTPVNPTSPDQLCGPWQWQIWREMSGDHICEQHVHNIDIANWFLGAHPVSAGGFGYRIHRVAGNMYDFFSVDFEYPGAVHIHSMCRQMIDCWEWIGEDFTFEHPKPAGFKLAGKDPYAEPGYHNYDGYVSEHMHLLYAVLKGRELNEARNVAWSTGAAILGRESAYTGQRITWQQMFEDSGSKFYKYHLRPTAEDFETGQVQMPKDGDVRFPGKMV
jgi:predicted dehydrogenase